MKSSKKARVAFTAFPVRLKGAVFQKFLIVILIGMTSLAWAGVSSYVPAQWPNTEFLDRLESYGCASTSFRALLPVTHQDLLEALVPYAERPCPAPEWLLKEREILFRPVLQSEARASLMALDEDLLPLLGQEAAVAPDYPLREGRYRFKGITAFGEMVLNSGSGADWSLALSVTPGFALAMQEYSEFLGRFYLHEGYAKVGVGYAELTLGRISPRFGDIKHGSLLLSGSALPLDMVKFAVRPHWTGFLDFLGPITFETWFSDDGALTGKKGAKIWAWEFGARPYTFFEFGFLNLMHFGGQGSVDIGASDLLKMFFAASDDETKTKRHQSFATYLGFWGPNRGFKFYNQLMFNQLGAVSDWFSKDISFLLGLWLPKLGKADLRLEFVQTSPSAYTDSRWTQGWSVYQTPLGHSLGSNSTGFYADLGLPPLENWRPTLSVWLENRNKDAVLGAFGESRYTFSTEFTRRWLAMEISALFRYAMASNVRYQDGVDASSFSSLAMLRYSFL